MRSGTWVSLTLVMLVAAPLATALFAPPPTAAEATAVASPFLHAASPVYGLAQTAQAAVPAFLTQDAAATVRELQTLAYAHAATFDAVHPDAGASDLTGIDGLSALADDVAAAAAFDGSWAAAAALAGPAGAFAVHESPDALTALLTFFERSGVDAETAAAQDAATTLASWPNDYQAITHLLLDAHLTQLDAWDAAHAASDPSIMVAARPDVIRLVGEAVDRSVNLGPAKPTVNEMDICNVIVVSFSSASQTRSCPYNLAFDLGGDDTWSGNSGGAQTTCFDQGTSVPLANCPFGPYRRPAALHVDVNGADTYLEPVDMTATTGSGYGAFGFALDVTGNDAYLTGDTYWVGGSAVFGGAGTMIDGTGDDAWTGTGRHASATSGLAFVGTDAATFFEPGIVADAFFLDPLGANDYTMWDQGFFGATGACQATAWGVGARARSFDLGGPSTSQCAYTNGFVIDGGTALSVTGPAHNHIIGNGMGAAFLGGTAVHVDLGGWETYGIIEFGGAGVGHWFTCFFFCAIEPTTLQPGVGLHIDVASTGGVDSYQANGFANVGVGTGRAFGAAVNTNGPNSITSVSGTYAFGVGVATGLGILASAGAPEHYLLEAGVTGLGAAPGGVGLFAKAYPLDAPPVFTLGDPTDVLEPQPTALPPGDATWVEARPGSTILEAGGGGTGTMLLEGFDLIFSHLAPDFTCAADAVEIFAFDVGNQVVRTCTITRTGETYVRDPRSPANDLDDIDKPPVPCNMDAELSGRCYTIASLVGPDAPGWFESSTFRPVTSGGVQQLNTPQEQKIRVTLLSGDDACDLACYLLETGVS